MGIRYDLGAACITDKFSLFRHRLGCLLFSLRFGLCLLCSRLYLLCLCLRLLCRSGFHRMRFKLTYGYRKF
jgi:hypothetical protein